jgi:hypothetical protein
MKLAKSLLLGSATAFVAVAGANAADLPSKKAAPATYVKVCDAYGAGFYTIPGTDTCIKIGGRVRSDTAYVGAKTQLATPTAIPFAAPTAVTASVAINVNSSVTAAASYATYLVQPTGTRLNVSDSVKDARSMHTVGWESRARVDFDARTPTAYGTVQTVGSLRLARTTGVLAVPNGAQSSSAGATLEAAYIRFAGFTFGAARDNFAFMPSRFYGAGHWGSFANGAKQIAYTAALGGGFTATLAVQDPVDTTVGGYDYTFRNGTAPGSISSRGAVDSARLNPQFNARIDFDQSWGSLSLTGAARQLDAQSTTLDRFNQTKNAWAVGAGAKINLPQLAKGDAIWLTAAYADGMTEYTTNWSSFKSSAYRSDVGGIVINHPSYVMVGGDGTNGPANGIETVKSWNVAMVADHFWTPNWRSSFLASYGAIKAPDAAKSCTSGVSASSRYVANSNLPVDSMAAGCFGDAKVWNVGKQIAFIPTPNFEIGVEVLYARTQLTMPAGGSGTTDATVGCSTTGNGAANATCSFNNWSGRLRVERTF